MYLNKFLRSKESSVFPLSALVCRNAEFANDCKEMPSYFSTSGGFRGGVLVAELFFHFHSDFKKK